LEDHIKKLKKEGDFHRMHHKRVGQEKTNLQEELKKVFYLMLYNIQLKQKHEATKPQLEELQKQAEQSRKEKIIAQLEKDKLLKRVAYLTYFLSFYLAFGNNHFFTNSRRITTS
jgi:hypothetical protein